MTSAADPLTLFLPDFYVYLFVFTRLMGVILMLPGLSDHHVPGMIRISFALALALAYGTPHHAPTGNAMAPMVFFVAILGEVFIGFGSALIIRLFFAALDVAGSLIGFQTGLANIMLSSPASAEQSALIGALLTFIAMTLFFVSDLYAVFFSALGRSFDLFPPGTVAKFGSLHQDFFHLILQGVTASFHLAVLLAGPIVIVSLLVSLGSGILSRLVPQIQIFFITQPLLILLGFFLLFLTLGPMMKLVFYFLQHNQLFSGSR